MNFILLLTGILLKPYLTRMREKTGPSNSTYRSKDAVVAMLYFVVIVKSSPLSVFFI